MLGAIIGCITAGYLRPLGLDRVTGSGTVGVMGLYAGVATSASEPELARLLAHEPPAVARLVRRLREVVREAHPELRERVSFGWHGVSYHHPRGGYVFALFPRDGGVNVGFEYGADLPDPHGRLVGKRRQRTRDVRMEVDADAAEEEVMLDYVDVAVAIAIDRASAKGR
jgi:hypothetical protein